MSKVMGHRDAAEFLGIHPQTLRNRVLRGYVRAAQMDNGELVYDESDLLICQSDMKLQPSETTLRMVAKSYAVKYHQVLRAFRVHNAKPLRRIGRLAVYSAATAAHVAGKEGWNDG